MSLKITDGYEYTTVMIRTSAGWLSYELNTIKIKKTPVLVRDSEININGTVRSYTEGIRFNFECELAARDGTQEDLNDVMNAYYAFSEIEYFKIKPFMGANTTIEPMTEFSVVMIEPPQVVEYKTNRTLGQKLVFTCRTKNMYTRSNVGFVYVDDGDIQYPAGIIDIVYDENIDNAY